MKQTKEEFYCDNCNAYLPFSSNICIVTSKSEASIGWERLHVVIERHHGVHNDAETEPAVLCQKCAYTLLLDAANRVKAGERVSAGVDDIDMEKFQ